MFHDCGRSILGLSTVSTKPYRLPDRMNYDNQFVQSVKTGIGLDHFLQDAPYHVSGYLILPSKTNSLQLVVLILLVVDSGPYHITVAHVL